MLKIVSNEAAWPDGNVKKKLSR